MRIAINAGHCPGLDSGACGVYSYEADINEAVSKVVFKKLLLLGYEALYIQENELSDICYMSNRFEADIFVSIHCNAAENTDASGTETFYYEYGDESYILAENVQEQLVNTLGTVDRGLKDGKWLYVINNTDAPASILVELGFISNEEEEDVMNTSINEMAQAITDGIVAYLGGRNE